VVPSLCAMVSANIPKPEESQDRLIMRQLQKGQRVRTTVSEKQGGAVLCSKGDLGTVIAVQDHTVALVNWDNYGMLFPTVTDYLRRVDDSDEAIEEGVEVVRTRPVMDATGGTLLAANQRGTVIRLESRVGVAVRFDARSGAPKKGDGSPSSANAIWMSHGLRPVADVFSEEVDDLLAEFCAQEDEAWALRVPMPTFAASKPWVRNWN
jgi:hypothetical protein